MNKKSVGIMLILYAALAGIPGVLCEYCHKVLIAMSLNLNMRNH